MRIVALDDSKRVHKTLHDFLLPLADVNCVKQHLLSIHRGIGLISRDDHQHRPESTFRIAEQTESEIPTHDDTQRVKPS